MSLRKEKNLSVSCVKFPVLNSEGLDLNKSFINKVSTFNPLVGVLINAFRKGCCDKYFLNVFSIS